MVKVNAKAAAKALRAHRATALLRHAEMGHKAHKALHALKAKAMAAVRAVAVKSNVAIPVLTTVVMARAAPPRAVLVPRAVAPTVADKAAVKAGKTTITTMAMNCHATSIP